MSYYTLVASLPHLPPHFDVDRLPITRPALEERLESLRPEHQQVLQRLFDFLQWDRQPVDRTDQAMVEAYEHLLQTIHNPLVRELVDHRVDIRTIVSALRRRKAEQSPPIGIGRLVETIRRNWNHPQFNLARQHPWIVLFQERMDTGDAVGAERVLLQVTWENWARLAADYTFSFEAVLLYLARWSILDRWTSKNAAEGRERFERLVEETLGEYAQLEF
jgi:hypothetical protein